MRGLRCRPIPRPPIWLCDREERILFSDIQIFKRCWAARKLFSYFSNGILVEAPCFSKHCKWTAGDNPIYCKCLVPIYVFSCCFQNRIIMFCLPISTLMYLWAIYIFGIVLPILLQPNRRTEYINRSQIHVCMNWERGRMVSFLEIHNRIFDIVRRCYSTCRPQVRAACNCNRYFTSHWRFFDAYGSIFSN